MLKDNQADQIITAIRILAEGEALCVMPNPVDPFPIETPRARSDGFPLPRE